MFDEGYDPYLDRIKRNIEWKAKPAIDKKPSKPKRRKFKSRKGLDVRIPFTLIDNTDWLKQNRNDTTLYLVLRSYIVRGKSASDPFDLYNRYYMDNKLVTGIGVDFLSQLFGYKDHHQICKMLDRLEAKGAFEVFRLPQKPPLKPKKIYLLGETIQGDEVWKWK